MRRSVDGRRPHALYRFWDSSDVLLYVGITLNPGERWKQHRADKPWWSEVAKVTVENHPDRAAVLDAERDAILAEGPKYNIVHNGQRPTLAGAILRLDGPTVVITCQVCRRPVVGDGYVWVDNAEIAACERAWAEFDERRGGKSWQPVGLEDLFALPDEAEWQAHHARCDPNPDRSSYSIQANRIDTAAKLLDWTAHLMGKSWLGHTNWDNVIRSAAGVDA